MNIRPPIGTCAQKSMTSYEEPRKCFHGFSCSGQPTKSVFCFMEQIGKGSFGKVYKAKCFRARDCNVAIKVVPFIHNKYKSSLMFNIDNETKVLDILKEKPHRNIIEFFGFFDDDDCRNYVFELGDMNFYEYMEKAKSRLTVAQFHEVIFQFIEGIEHLNTIGLYNFDIHPVNMVILLSSGSIKFIDFGGAKILDHPNNQKCLYTLSIHLASYQLSIKYDNHQVDTYEKHLSVFKDTAWLKGDFSEIDFSELLKQPDLWCSGLSEEVKKFVAMCFFRDLDKRADLLRVKRYLAPRERLT